MVILGGRMNFASIESSPSSIPESADHCLELVPLSPDTVEVFFLFLCCWRATCFLAQDEAGPAVEAAGVAAAFGLTEAFDVMEGLLDLLPSSVVE